MRQLAASEAAGLADALFAAERSIESEKESALAAFRAELNAATGEERRKQLSRSAKQLQKGRIPEFADGPLQETRRRLEDLHTAARELRVKFQEEFAKGVLSVSQALRETVADPQFQQAVLLQNRDALRRVTNSFLRPKRGFKERQNEEMVASYLQRYCLKNDTIGFFGPVGWARFSENAQTAELEPGPGLVAHSAIFFENWCIETLAEKFAEDCALRPWMRPRLLPFFHIEGDKLRSGSKLLSTLPRTHLAILRKCNGELMPREIARSLITAGADAITEEQVHRLLEIFAARGIISWKFEIPLCLHPEQHLRQLLEEIEDKELKRPLLEALNQLDESRKAVARAFGNPARLSAALEALDETFSRLTGKSPTKSAGSMYASRTLIYQDCRRDARVEFGPEIVASMGTPLSLLLESARWFSYRSAELYRREFERIYDELAQKSGSDWVELMEFWSRIELLVFDPAQRPFNQVLAEFQSHWGEILDLPLEASRVERSSSDLMPLVRERFAAPRPGWRLARYHSPDVMIAAADVEAVRRGEYCFVLGEVHVTTNTQRFSFALSQHPAPEQLLHALAADFPESHVLPVPPRQWPRITNRTAIAVVSPHDYYLEIARDSIANAPRSYVLSIASLIIRRASTGLAVEKRDGSLSFDPVEFIGELLSGAAVEMMKILSPRRHMPRITLDRLVITRESWSFPATEWQFVNQEEEHQRFLETRRWMRERGLPRFVFVRVPVEVKPFYLDFDSPVYVEIFCKMVRRMLASHRADELITMTEMLPTTDQLWLRDSDGRAYTSELRIVAKDPR
jgi:hypothetical protein